MGLIQARLSDIRRSQVGECRSCRLAIAATVAVRTDEERPSHGSDTQEPALSAGGAAAWWRPATPRSNSRVCCDVDFGGGRDLCRYQSTAWQSQRASRRSALWSAAHYADRRLCWP